MKQEVLWAVHLPLCCVCLGHLVAATGGTYTIKVHNIKFHSVSGFDRRSRRRRWQRRLRGCVAIETAEAILHFVAHFMGSHCVANAKAIVVVLVASVVLVLVGGVVVVVVGKAYLPFSWPLVWAHFLTYIDTHTCTPSNTHTLTHRHPHRHRVEKVLQCTNLQRPKSEKLCTIHLTFWGLPPSHSGMDKLNMLNKLYVKCKF